MMFFPTPRFGLPPSRTISLALIAFSGPFLEQASAHHIPLSDSHSRKHTNIHAVVNSLLTHVCGMANFIVYAATIAQLKKFVLPASKFLFLAFGLIGNFSLFIYSKTSAEFLHTDLALVSNLSKYILGVQQKTNELSRHSIKTGISRYF